MAENRRHFSPTARTDLPANRILPATTRRGIFSTASAPLPGWYSSRESTYCLAEGRGVWRTFFYPDYHAC